MAKEVSIQAVILCTAPCPCFQLSRWTSGAVLLLLNHAPFSSPGNASARTSKAKLVSGLPHHVEK